MRFAAAEWCAKFQYPVIARLARKGSQNLIEESFQVRSQVCGAEKGLRVAVHNWDVRISYGNSTEVDSEQRLGERSCLHIRVKLY